MREVFRIALRAEKPQPNSPNVIHHHYKGLVKEADATEFWTITPETVKSEVAKFPAKAAA
jgi:hypothetical protein